MLTAVIDKDRVDSRLVYACTTFTWAVTPLLWRHRNRSVNIFVALR